MSASVWNAFCTKIGTYASTHSPALPVSYYGGAKNQSETGPWLYVKPFESGGDDLGLASGSDAYDIGMMRVFVYTRYGLGLHAVQDICDELQALFPIGTTFGNAFTEKTPSIGGPMSEDELSALFMYVSVEWRKIR